MQSLDVRCCGMNGPLAQTRPKSDKSKFRAGRAFYRGTLLNVMRRVASRPSWMWPPLYRASWSSWEASTSWRGLSARWSAYPLSPLNSPLLALVCPQEPRKGACVV